MNRDKLRAMTLGRDTQFTREIVTYENEDYEIRQPSVFMRNEIITRSQVDNKTSPLMFLVWSIIYCTYVPGTDEYVFDENDYDVLINNPTGSFVDLFGVKATDLINIDFDAKKKL